MELKDSFKITGQLMIKKFDQEGKLVEVRDHKNLVVQTGKELLAKRLISDTRPAILTTSGSANGTTATLNFASQPAVPYQVGSQITVSGVIPSAFNGTFRVVSATTTSVTYELSSTSLTVTTNGQIDSLLNGTVKTMRIGTTGTPANLSDVALYTQNGSVNLYSSGHVIDGEDVSVLYVALFPAGVGTTTSGVSIQEAGLFNESNKMLCRTVFPPLSKLAGESLEIFWKITIA